MTDDAPDAWMLLDLKGWNLVPDYYCLRGVCTSGDHNHALQNWDLEGSVDRTHWDVLRSHREEQQLKAGVEGCVGAWPIDAHGKSYRFFRLSMRGPSRNADGLISKHSHLCCGGIELYGELM